MTPPATVPDRAPASRGLPFGWCLAVVVAIAALPRLVEAARTPLVFDEIYAVMLARTGLAGLMGILAHDVDQPLHYVLVWLWRLAGGEGKLWVKAIPLAWALGTVALTGLLGRRLFGAGAGLAAALLLAVQPTHILFSQQASFHAMVWFLLTLAFAAGWSWVERPRARDAVTLVLAAAAAIYTDHYSSIVLGAIALWGLGALARTPKRMAAWLSWFAAAFALYLPQLPTLLTQWDRDVRGERALAPLGAAEIADLLRKLAWNAKYLIPILILLALVPFVSGARRRAAAALWFVCLAGVLVPWALSQSGIHLYISKQMYFAIPLWCLLLAAGLATLRWRGPGIVVLLVLVAFGARSWRSRRPAPEAIELPRAVAYLKEHAAPGDPVFCCETRGLLFLKYYLPDLVDSKLLIMPQAEAFHYSDGILIVPPGWQVPFAEWTARRGPHGGWWGLRLQHAGRDGPEAAAALEAAASGRAVRMERTTLWIGAAGDSAGTSR
jgi:mannosyltransferase